MKRQDKYIERFEQLVRVMSGLTREQRKLLDMDHWGRETDCGTAMCVAGFCGSDVWFRRRGFRLVRHKNSSRYGIRYKRAQAWPAVTDFFAGGRSVAGNLHDIFFWPKNVPEIIRAAKQQIRILKRDAA